MKGHTVVRRYARALYEASRDLDLHDLLEEDMDILDRLMGDVSEIREFCLTADPSSEKSRVFIETALLPYLGEMTGTAVRLMEQNRRLGALPYLTEALRDERDRDLGVTRVRIETVSSPDKQLKQDILEGLGKRIPGKLEADWCARSDLMGGMTFQWNNRLLDLSLKSRIGQLKRVLYRKSE